MQEKWCLRAWGGDFLRRLFIAKSLHSTDASQKYRDLALIILAYLVEDLEIARQFLDIKNDLISHFCLIKSGNREEAAQCLVALCRVGTTEVINSLISSKACPSPRIIAELASELKSSSSSKILKSCAMYLITQIYAHTSNDCLQSSDTKACIDALAVVFATVTKSAIVFDALSILVRIFEKDIEFSPETSNGKSGWKDLIHEGLFRMMRSKIPINHRLNVLRLLNFMVSTQAPSWCITGGLAHPNRQPSDFCVLMAKSVMIESRVNADNIARVVVDDGSKDKTTAKRSLDILGCCNSLVEHSVVHLLATSEDVDSDGTMMWQDLPAEQLLMLRDAFVDVVNASLDIVAYAGRALKSKECAIAESNPELVEALCICFRLISTWMSVDAGSILDHVLNIVGPFEAIITSCRAQDPSQSIVEYCLPTLAILVDDFGAREDFDKSLLVPKLREFEAMFERGYKKSDGHLKDFSDESLREMSNMLKHVLQVLEY